MPVFKVIELRHEQVTKLHINARIERRNPHAGYTPRENLQFHCSDVKCNVRSLSAPALSNTPISRRCIQIFSSSNFYSVLERSTKFSTIRPAKKKNGGEKVSFNLSAKHDRACDLENLEVVEGIELFFHVDD